MWHSYDNLNKMKTTMAPELFFSFLAHAIALYFILTLPISNIGNMSFDTVSVALVSGETEDSGPQNDERAAPVEAQAAQPEEKTPAISASTKSRKTSTEMPSPPLTKPEPSVTETRDKPAVTPEKEMNARQEEAKGTDVVAKNLIQTPPESSGPQITPSLPAPGGSDISESPGLPDESGNTPAPNTTVPGQTETPVPGIVPPQQDAGIQEEPVTPEEEPVSEPIAESEERPQVETEAVAAPDTVQTQLEAEQETVIEQPVPDAVKADGAPLEGAEEQQTGFSLEAEEIKSEEKPGQDQQSLTAKGEESGKAKPPAPSAERVVRHAPKVKESPDIRNDKTDISPGIKEKTAPSPVKSAAKEPAVNIPDMSKEDRVRPARTGIKNELSEIQMQNSPAAPEFPLSFQAGKPAPQSVDMELPKQKESMEALKTETTGQAPPMSTLPSPVPPVLLGEEIIYRGWEDAMPSPEMSVIPDEDETQSSVFKQPDVLPTQKTEHLTEDAGEESLSKVEAETIDSSPADAQTSDLPEEELVSSNEPQAQEDTQEEREEIPAAAEDATDADIVDVLDSVASVMEDLLVAQEASVTPSNDGNNEHLPEAEVPAQQEVAALPLPATQAPGEQVVVDDGTQGTENGTGILEEIHTAGTENENTIVADIQTPGMNRTPSGRAYQLQIDDKISLNHSETEAQQRLVKEKGLVLPLDVFNDIEAEVYLHEMGNNILFALDRRPHPMAKGSPRSRGEEVDLKVTDRYGEPEDERVMIYVERADKGVYTLKIKNNSETSFSLTVNFRLYAGREAEKEYHLHGITLKAHEEAGIMFLMPEGVFWEEKEYFTGEMENSGYITKFNADTGLVWKEKKGW